EWPPHRRQRHEDGWLARRDPVRSPERNRAVGPAAWEWRAANGRDLLEHRSGNRGFIVDQRGGFCCRSDHQLYPHLVPDGEGVPAIDRVRPRNRKLAPEPHTVREVERDG